MPYKVTNTAKMPLRFEAKSETVLSLKPGEAKPITDEVHTSIKAALDLNKGARRVTVEAMDGSPVVEDAPDESTKPDGDVGIDDIVQAIGLLNPDEDGQFTQGGKPEVKALEELLGQDISAAQRDEAWTKYQSEAE